MTWHTQNNKLRKEFHFDTFMQAMHFVNKVAALAEELQHHPDITVTYNHVTIETWTHESNKITQKDHELTKLIDAL